MATLLHDDIRERGTYVARSDGRSARAALGADEQAALWARCLHTGCPGLVEVAAGRRDARGMLRMRSRSNRRGFPLAGDTGAFLGLVRYHRSRGDEVFATPLTREQPRAGHAGVILPGAVAWIDLDDGRALARLRAFPHRPTLVVASGSGGAHAYWRLVHEHSPDDIESANRKLCAALEGDAACTDRARIMRVPGTVNHKADRACRLLYVDLARPGIELASLVAGLVDPAPPPPPPTAADLRRRRALRSDDPARDVPPPTYFSLLAGVQVPDHGGHIPCPLPDHDEEIPSCRVYGTAEEGWRCYGCQRGGTIYDFASLLDHGPWGRGLRGEAFRETRRRVHAALGLER